MCGMEGQAMEFKQRIERPCGECLWHGDDGCTKWECEPVTLEEARKIVRKDMEETK